MGVKEVSQLPFHPTGTSTKDTLMIHLGQVASANRACSLLYSYIKEQPYGKWLLPVNVCPDVPLTFALAGVPFQFIDIDLSTLCIDVEECRRILSNDAKVAGIVYVRTYGYISEMSEQFKSLRKIKPEIRIVDDRCLCIPEEPVEFGGADMILYSTGKCKPVDFGGGGLAFYANQVEYKVDEDLYYNGTDEECLYKEAYSSGMPLKTIPKGWLHLGQYKEPAIYLQEIAQNKKERSKQRKKINSIYCEFLPESICLQSGYQDWRFNILVPPELKQEILDSLFANGLFASSHYHSANRLFDNNEYKNSDRLFSGVINLFNDKYYTEERAINTCKIINEIMRKHTITPPIYAGS
jgi:dTDP-4-amino-4,6-dideoxygalactose transaminase